MRAAGGTGTIQRQGDASLVWLAVVALLINALSPVGLSSIPTGRASGLIAGFCGHAPDDPPPGLPLPHEHHCPLCCATPPGALPIDGGKITGPSLIGHVSLALATTVPGRRPLPYGSAQPRGPPSLA